MKEIYLEVAELIKTNKGGVICTIINSLGSTPRHEGSKMLLFSDGHISGSVGGGEIENWVIREAKQAFIDGRTKLVSYDMVDTKKGDPGICGGHVDVFIEPIVPHPRIVIIGGGHVGRAVAHIARWVGFTVAVSDDRIEFCTPEANPDAEEFYPIKMSEIPSHLEITTHTYLVLTTRGMDVDVEGLPSLINTNTAYIGIIGSKRRWEMTKKQLLTMGISKEALSKVHSPIGLELQAESPEEIAISIIAEIIMLRNGGSGKIMKIG